MIHKPKSNVREIRTAPIREVRVATSDDGTHSVSGYAIVFNSPSMDLGGFTEVVGPGSLARTLSGNADVLCLRDHKPELLLGRTTSGSLTLVEDQIGLQFTCSLPATSAASDLAESLRRGDINSCSFGFAAFNDTWTQDSQGNILRNLLDIELFEISIVSFPAYESTSASIRSAPMEIRSLIKSSRSAKACKCDCSECQDGECDDCSDPDCDDALCSCDGERTRSHRKQHLELRLRLLETTL